MVIFSSSDLVNNMSFTSKALIFSAASMLLLVLLSTTIYADENNIKSTTFISEKFEVRAGAVANKILANIEFPRGHVGIKSFDAEIVDEKGNSVPTYEVYLHHWFALKYHEKIWRQSSIPKDPKNPLDGIIFLRNEGACEGGVLPHYWGLGIESRGTSTKIPNPYALEVGKLENIGVGYEEKWLFNVMVIDTRGTKDSKGCTECRCDHFNLPLNHFNVTIGIDGKPLNPNYKGGIFCCVDNAQCTLKEGFKAPKRYLALRYKITWVDWDRHQIPVRFYILDSTDRVRTNGSKIIHECQAEYTINPKGISLKPSSRPHVQRANIPMKKGGYLIYATSHMHSGVLDATLYGQDGKLLCNSTPKYGTGNEAGNEKGYVIGMSGCYPEPGSIKIENGEIVKVESRYKGVFLTGAMGHVYIYLADKLPSHHKDTKCLSNGSLLLTQANCVQPRPMLSTLIFTLYCFLIGILLIYFLRQCLPNIWFYSPVRLRIV